ncbi:MAG: YciI family protein [Ferruginibacter sp.]
MAEYLLIFRGGDAARMEEQQSPEKWQAHMQKWMEWMGALTNEGKFVGAQPLKAAGKVVTGTSKVVTDGPFVEGKEMVGGYLVCKVENLEEAVEISKGCPILEHEGSVEVREISEMKM